MTVCAGVTTWVIVALAVLLTGGEVGAYSNNGLPVLWTASLALIWVGGIALAVTLMLLVFQRRQARGGIEENPADYAEQESHMLADDAAPAERAQGEGAEDSQDAGSEESEELGEQTDASDKTAASDKTDVAEDGG